MSSRFERRPSRPTRGGDPGGGRPLRSGPRGNTPRRDSRGSGPERRDRGNERGETPWRGSRDYGRTTGRAGVRSIDGAGRERRDSRGSDRRFSERNREVPMRSRGGEARGGRSLPSRPQGSRPQKFERSDRRFEEKPRGEASSHSADPVADDLL